MYCNETCIFKIYRTDVLQTMKIFIRTNKKCGTQIQILFYITKIYLHVFSERGRVESPDSHINRTQSKQNRVL